jgi:hypothetical protein
MALVPWGEVTVTSIDPAISDGARTVILVPALFTLRLVASSRPNITTVAPFRLVPSMATLLPPAPGPDEPCSALMTGASGLVSAAVTAESVVEVEDETGVDVDVDVDVVVDDEDDIVDVVVDEDGEANGEEDGATVGLVVPDDPVARDVGVGVDPLLILVITRAVAATINTRATATTTLPGVEEKNPVGGAAPPGGEVGDWPPGVLGPGSP